MTDLDMASRAVRPAELRKVFGAFPSGVVAVCACVDGVPTGMAVSTFTPVSLDPPLISLCIQRTSTTWPRLRSVPRLGVSVLAEHHEAAGRQLSVRTGDRFAGLETTTVDDGAVLLERAAAWFTCAVEHEVAAGDHLIAVLRLDRCGVSERVRPLVFHDSRFRTFLES